jgi:hypothetical protein
VGVRCGRKEAARACAYSTIPTALQVEVGNICIARTWAIEDKH